MSVSQIFVVGMHRSGTSAVTNLLANMGANFGDEADSIGQNAENPKGFWERRDVRQANDLILHSMGCEWDAVSHWKLESLTEATRTTFQQQAKTIIKELDDCGRSFVIKDPRLCLLLPLWIECVESPVVVYVHRNPIEIAKSLKSRNGYPLEFGVKLWETYATHALQYTQGIPTLFVDYHSVIDNELREIDRIGKFLNLCGADDLFHGDSVQAVGTVEARFRNQTLHADEFSLTIDQQRLSQYLLQRCQDENVSDSFDPVLVRSLDRDECLRALEKYSRTKKKYDELQLYRDSLKNKLSTLQANATALKHLKDSLKLEKNHLESEKKILKKKNKILLREKQQLIEEKQQLIGEKQQLSEELVRLDPAERMAVFLTSSRMLKRVAHLLKPFSGFQYVGGFLDLYHQLNEKIDKRIDDKDYDETR